MALEPRPYFVGNGVPHTAEAMRAALYNSTGGARGVTEPADLKISALPTPGSSVRAAPGGATIPSKYPGDSQQSYGPRNPTATDVPIASTGATARVDLVYLAIEDPFASGSTVTPPGDPAAGQYVFLRVAPNVPASTRRLSDVPALAGITGVELARIAIPANTATITNAMITDLRLVANPRSRRSRPVTPAPGGALQSVTETSWITQTVELDVPEYATRAQGVVTVHGAIQRGGGVQTFHRVQIGSTMSGTATQVDTDEDSVDTQRLSFGIPIDVFVPSADRGKPLIVRIRSWRVNAAGAPGRLYAGSRVQADWDIEFLESPA